MNNTFETVEWTHEEDVELGEVMLQVIADGGTVREGFEKYANQSEVRTVTASKFRFFSVVKKLEGYEERYEKARIKGETLRKGKKNKVKVKPSQQLNIFDENYVVKPEDFLTLAQKFAEQQQKHDLELALTEKDKEISELKDKVEQLQYKLKQANIDIDDLKVQLDDKTEQLKIISTAFGMINNIQENEKENIKPYKIDKNSMVVTS
ncbi:transcription factor [Bacillus phage Stahl]|uniref:Transcription factor n=1 Tax=Bacillus phage Stahl TaxID=1610832 RepID=A0A0E3JT21_9CAUD|nr:transcriptional regulator [Bacillus phage Stahl]AKA61455.1 transcription factor [Bacillus phage Stahl]